MIDLKLYNICEFVKLVKLQVATTVMLQTFQRQRTETEHDLAPIGLSVSSFFSCV